MQTRCLMLLLILVLSAFGDSDFEALLELKKGLEKSPFLSSWNSKFLASNGCPENWYGVVCIDGNVVSIALNNVGLVGNFTFPILTGLKKLQNISISNNKLMGTISDIGSIESLENLDLSCNLFSGFLPSAIVSLNSLVVLNLSSNNFQGMVPSGFGNLEKLKYLDLGTNSFSEDIMSLLSQLGSVVHVDLSSNQFTGSLDLGLGNANFVSSIRYLNVSRNSLAGQLFAHDGMPFFDSLEVFDASNNMLTGVIPPFQFVVSLQIIKLGNNRFSGSLPEALLQDNSMVLSELDLSLNQLEGPIRKITSATLKKLNLSSNKLSGPLPAIVAHCSIIDLSNNMLSGELSRIRNWGNYVEVIQLSNNSLSGSFPNQTSQFLRLTSLNLSNNSLNGELPSVLDSYPELRMIDLSHNFINGSLLPSLFNSTTLTELILSANNFTGSIPLQEVRNSTQNLSLVSLDLSYNSFDGSLPPEISKFRNLLYLDLSNNRLKGNIPEDLPDGLRGFNVSSNNLSGVIPDNLRRFPDSAFHPGNSLLSFANSSLSNGAPSLTSKDHQSRMKRAVKIILIAGAVCTVSIIAIFCMLIYFKSRSHKPGRTSLEGDEKQGVAEEHSSLPHASGTNKSLDRSLSSFSFHQLGPACDQGDTSAVHTTPKDHPESLKKDGGVSSPLSLVSSSNPSPSNYGQLSTESPVALQVYSPERLAGDLHLFDVSLAFTAEELSRAPAELIGRSCHGSLYKATLDSGNVLAVKWLKEGISKGRKEFARELKKLGNIRHPNLVSVLGFYWGPKEHEKMILSNYINGYCLAFLLQETEPRKLPPLSLPDRLRIAVNIAGCLNYLHNEKAIPHGNLKSTNILLQPADMNPLLTDYSLHRILTSAGTAEQVLNAGALGYRPPEFASSSKPCPSLKSDVYAFGVILLEILTGKSCGEIVSAESGGVDLTEWVRLLAAENRPEQCFDRLIVEGTNGDASRVLGEVLQVALRCVLSASDRPDIRTVFEDLAMIVS
ncbi:LRR receptor-like serine/threonine-protein kinase GHR1 [Euphorbia lathyris]|uniref:LRR receptor-like serine/threonine-protein kinase GHR1 n=1 Tax=Euphorbia lathyris TaxID=212925 RepID=UPI0033130FEB